MSTPGHTKLRLGLLVAAGLMWLPLAEAGIRAPCREETEKLGSLEACSGAIPRLVSEIRDAVQKDVDKKYRGEDEGAYGVEPRSFRTPVCSVTANELTSNQKEVSSSHLGQSCGLAARARYYKRGRRKVVFYTQYGGGYGYWEGAIDRGAWVQALACSMKESLRLLEGQKIVNTPAPESLISEYDQHVEFARKTANPDAVAKCDSKWLKAQGAGAGGSEDGRDKVSQENILNCQANAYREQLQVAFKHIAMLGIYSKADEAYAGFLAKLYEVPSKGKLKDEYYRMIKDRCRGISGSGEMQSCYEKKYRELIEANVQSEIIAKGCGQGGGQ